MTGRCGVFFASGRTGSSFSRRVGLAVCAGLAALGYWYFVSPTVLTVAVGPRDGPEARLMRAYAEALAERRREIRLRIVPFDDVKSSAEALQQNKTDLAVVRPDVLLPVERLDRRDPARGGAHRPRPGREQDRRPRGRSPRSGSASSATTTRTFPPSAPCSGITTSPLRISPSCRSRRGAVAEAFRAKRIDALAFLAAPYPARRPRSWRAVRAASSGKVTVIPVDEAEALALQTPALSDDDDSRPEASPAARSCPPRTSKQSPSPIG